MPVLIVLKVGFVVHFVKIILDECSNFFPLSTPKFRGDISLLTSRPASRASAFCSASVFCDNSSFQENICRGCLLTGHRHSCKRCSRSSLLQVVSQHRYCAWARGIPILLGYTRSLLHRPRNVSVSPTDCCCSGKCQSWPKQWFLCDETCSSACQEIKRQNMNKNDFFTFFLN